MKLIYLGQLFGIAFNIIPGPEFITPYTRNLIIHVLDAPNNLHDLELTFHPNIEYKKIYVYATDRYIFPSNLLSEHRNLSAIFLSLVPGQSWVDEEYLHNKRSVGLFVSHVNLLGVNVTLTEPVRVATIVKSTGECPTQLNQLRDLNPSVKKLIQSIQNDCDKVVIHSLRSLHWKLYDSLSLLYLDPPIFIINGTSYQHSTGHATQIIDKFLGAHSVLDIAWEPLLADDPLWWILVPKPRGHPGHVYALIDFVQWRHPKVQQADKLKRECRNASIAHTLVCENGCPETVVRKFTMSGWHASAGHAYNIFKSAFFLSQPFQAAPYGPFPYRIIPPLWEGAIGWHYTYGGCESNFLDCHFLDHSPCPHIRTMNVEPNDRNKPIGWDEVPTSYDWFNKAVGRTNAAHAGDTNYIFYSYLFRPNYRLRLEINQRVTAFNLELGSCALMHVRRGDAVMDPGSNARTYIPLEAYVRAARPLMDKAKIHTILLMTDGQAAVQEALSCAKDFPDICKGINWRYVDKKRFFAAEGGWENHFPSGNTTEELFTLQFELALAQKCPLMVAGTSGYSMLLNDYNGYRTPIRPRNMFLFQNETTKQYAHPMTIILNQYGYRCEDGNKLLCDAQGDESKLGGYTDRPLDDPTNMGAANYSITKDAFRDNPEVIFGGVTIRLRDLPTSGEKLKPAIKAGLERICNHARVLHYERPGCS